MSGEDWEDPPSVLLGDQGTCEWYVHSFAHDTVCDVGHDRFLEVVTHLPKILSSS